tara:strand:- start:882 stop:2609 length:1728 start_codon:yes stop_codon:yes gene_type:complete
MGRAEREGWNTWENYLKAGVVEDSLLWADDALRVDNTLGRIKETIGMSWPIDAAVAYTLANHGPDGRLKWSDFVNQNTRIASVMMTGKVGYSLQTNPTLESCGHDEVDCALFTLKMPMLTTQNEMSIEMITWHTHKPITKWSGWVNMPTSLQQLCEIRVPKDVIDDVSMDVVTSTLSTKEYLPVMKYISEYLKCDKFKVRGNSLCDSYTSSAFTQRSGYKGICGYDKLHTSYGACPHHNDVAIYDWFMIRKSSLSANEGFNTAWRRGKGTVVHSGWNRDQWYVRHDVGRVVLFNTVKRSLAQVITDEEVIKHVRDSLQRMRNWGKVGRNLVNKVGIGKNAEHTWSDWEWLSEIKHMVLTTSSRNRHENDTACSTCYTNDVVDSESKNICRCGDGWVYTKYGQKKSHGHEIANFEWRPISKLSMYALTTQGGAIRHALPYRFMDKKEAARARSAIPLIMSRLDNVSCFNRVWDLSTGSEVLHKENSDIGLSIIEVPVEIKMSFDKEPEALPNAKEMVRMIWFGIPREREDALELCKGKPKENAAHNWNSGGQMTDVKTMSLINSADNVLNVQGVNE